MLWRSLHGTLDEIRRELVGAEAAEIRLDLSPLSPDEVVELFGATSVPLLATWHGEGGEASLDAAIRAGAALVDLPLGPEGVDPERQALAARHGCGVVASFHDYVGTPPRAHLAGLVERGFAAGAQIVKLACHVNEPRDAARLLGLLDDPRPVVAIGMGPLGRITRLAGAEWDRPLAFVAMEDGTPTAPGQLTERELRALLRHLHEDLP